MPCGSKFQMWLGWKPLTPPRQPEGCQPKLRYLKAPLSWKPLLNSLVRLLAGFRGTTSVLAHMPSSPYLSVGATITNITGWHLKQPALLVSPCQRLKVETRVLKDSFVFVFADGPLTWPCGLAQSSSCACLCPRQVYPVLSQ